MVTRTHTPPFEEKNVHGLPNNNSDGIRVGKNVGTTPGNTDILANFRQELAIKSLRNLLCRYTHWSLDITLLEHTHHPEESKRIFLLILLIGILFVEQI